MEKVQTESKFTKNFHNPNPRDLKKKKKTKEKERQEMGQTFT
jgi:hypothetical protein